MKLTTVNPTTGALLEHYSTDSDNTIELKMHAAEKAYSEWKRVSLSNRKEYIVKLKKVLLENKQKLATQIVLEMGKPITQAIAEIDKCGLACDYYLENIERFLQAEHISTSAKESYVEFHPIGTVLAILPWNYPIWQVIRCFVPIVLSGNTFIFKTSPDVAGCAQLLEGVMQEVFPENVFQVIYIENERALSLIERPTIRAATFTGSEKVGALVAEAAGRFSKKTLLELGGSDPFIVLKDADLKEAARVGAYARLQNNGQSCIAAKRFIVASEVINDFIELLRNEFRQTKVGDPMLSETQLGPVANLRGLEKLKFQVSESLRLGSELVVGGGVSDIGYFYEPTILRGAAPNSPAYREELFGPVATILEFADEQEAVKLANDTKYGLSSAIWSKDVDRAKKLSEELDTGGVFINSMTASNPVLPFGGVKGSGYGRELSYFGVKEFVNPKTIYIA